MTVAMRKEQVSQALKAGKQRRQVSSITFDGDEDQIGQRPPREHPRSARRCWLERVLRTVPINLLGQPRPVGDVSDILRPPSKGLV